MLFSIVFREVPYNNAALPILGRGKPPRPLPAPTPLHLLRIRWYWNHQFREAFALNLAALKPFFPAAWAASQEMCWETCPSEGGPDWGMESLPLAEP